MAITTQDQLVNAMLNASQIIIWSKASIANQAAGGFCSLWRATGSPAQGAIPGAAATVNTNTTGAAPFVHPTGGAKSYIARAFLISNTSSADIWLQDRLAHCGGLLGNVTSAQAVNVDVSDTGDNMVARRGATDYSGVQWWLEIYTDIGTTGVTATVTYTNAAGTPGRTTTVTIGGASPSNRAGRMFPIIGNNGEYIQSIQSIQHATTGTAGNYGITATRALTNVSLGLANSGVVYDWLLLGAPQVPDDAAIFAIVICGTTFSGTLNGSAKLIQG